MSQRINETPAEARGGALQDLIAEASRSIAASVIELIGEPTPGWRERMAQLEEEWEAQDAAKDAVRAGRIS